jgi:hypothetical protein
LLLYQFLPPPQGQSGPEALLVSGRGIVVGGKVYRQRPTRLEPQHAGLAKAIDSWLSFYMQEWATAPTQLGSDDRTNWKERLKLPEARVCPTCQQRFLARPGQTGIAWDIKPSA